MTNSIMLAERCEELGRKIDGAICNRDNLSAASQAIVIAMLVTMNADLFDKCAAALRARASTTNPGPSQ